MRVIHLIDSLAAHGAERSLVSLAPHLLARGLDYEVATLARPATLAGGLQETGVLWHDLSETTGRRSQQRAIESLIEERRPDIVHTTLYRSDVLGRSAAHTFGIPSVTTWASTGAIGGGFALRLKRRRTTSIDRWSARRVARVHAVSDPVARIVAARLGVPQERIDVIPRSRDHRALGVRTIDRVRAERSRRGLDRPTVVALARHDYVKGLDVLIEAAAIARKSIPDLLLLVAGDDGAATEQLHDLVERQQLSDVVRFIDAVDDVGGLLAAADVCAVPSRVEGFPGVVVEAMLVGTPLVVADIDAVRSAIPADAMARFAASGSPPAFADALVEALTNTEESSRRASAARDHARSNFTSDAVADATMAFYARALDREDALV